MDKNVTAAITPYKSKFFSILLCECILAVLIIATALILKYFMPDTFKAARKWYCENMLADTKAEEIVKGVYDEI